MEPSMYDVIGPIMVGPSSSHTAGAARIALITRNMCPFKDFKHIKYTLYGSFAETYKGHGTDKALLAGIMGYRQDDRHIKYAFDLIKEKPYTYEFIEDRSMTEYHPNTVKIDIDGINGKHFTTIGESIGGAQAVIRKINNIDVKITGDYNTLLVEQQDKPGVLAHIATVLEMHDINIAFTTLYRENRGETAYTVVETDDKISQQVVDDIDLHEHVISAIKFDVYIR